MRLETASERNEVKIMALKKLNQFNYFDAEGFFSKLKLITVGSTVWKEYGSNVVKGTKLEVVIASDKHRYNMALRRFRFLWHFCPCDIMNDATAPRQVEKGGEPHE